ncbi:MAG: hypothetical protein C0514_01190 [Candidatus Puniceispirillum sp.]|nr:hypothetical protein [Candidatus Puniceispirillum sp.]
MTLCVCWGASLWGSAKEVVFTEEELSIAAHLARFDDSPLLNDYTDTMTTFWRPDNFPLNEREERVSYCPGVYTVYALLLKAIAHPANEWAGFAGENIGILESKHPILFAQAAKQVPTLDKGKLSHFFKLASEQLERLRAQEPLPVKDAIIAATQKDLISLMHFYVGCPGVESIQNLLLMANGEIVHLRGSISQKTLDALEVPDGLENALKIFTPNWPNILMRIQQEDVPEEVDLNAQAQELLRSRALLEQGQEAVQVLSQAIKRNQDNIAHAQMYLAVIAPTITLQDPLVRLFNPEAPLAYPFTATSVFLTALQVYFSNGDPAVFVRKFEEIGPIYKGNTVEARLGYWFEDEGGAPVKGVLPIYEDWRTKVGPLKAEMFDNEAFLLTLKYYLSWWTAYTFADSCGEGAHLPREAFALAYTAWDEVDTKGTYPGFFLTSQDKEKLVRIPVMKDRWNLPTDVAKGDTLH